MLGEGVRQRRPGPDSGPDGRDRVRHVRAHGHATHGIQRAIEREPRIQERGQVAHRLDRGHAVRLERRPSSAAVVPGAARDLQRIEAARAQRPPQRERGGRVLDPPQDLAVPRRRTVPEVRHTRHSQFVTSASSPSPPSTPSRP